MRNQGRQKLLTIRPTGVQALIYCVVLAACTPSTPSVVPSTAAPTLGASCALPGKCGQPLWCEGKRVMVTGQIDPNNIFEQASHPNLPFQKFLIRTAAPMHDVMEVWVTASGDAARDIFQRVRSAASARSDVTVSGKAVGVDLPITGQCHRVVKLEIESASKLSVRNSGAIGGTSK